jgi:hypothetical protein
LNLPVKTFLFVHDFQIFGGIDDFDSPILFKFPQMYVARNDVIGVGGDRALQISVIGLVPATAVSNALGIGNFDFRADFFYTPYVVLYFFFRQMKLPLSKHTIGFRKNFVCDE